MAFISHSNLDLPLAERIAYALPKFGLTGFLAHRDLESGTEWREEIQRRLRESAVLIAVLTQNFVASKWTDHEVGFAVGRYVPIVPFDAGVAPYGFMAHIQSLRWGDETEGGMRPDGHWSEAELVERETKLGKALELRGAIDHGAILAAFIASGSWHGTRVLLPLLGDLNRLPDSEVRGVASAAATNSEIYNCNVAPGTLLPFFEGRRHLFGPDLVDGLKKVHLLK